MRSTIVALSLFAALPLRAAVNFDAGLSVKGVMAEVRADRSVIAAPASAGKRIVRWIPGSTQLELPPGERVVREFKLSSTSVIEQCTSDQWGEHCRETFGQTVTQSLRLIVERPAPAPDTDSELVEVVLEGREVRVNQLRVHTRYQLARRGQDLVLAPARLAADAKRIVRWIGQSKTIEVLPGQLETQPVTLEAIPIEEYCDFDPRGGMHCSERFGMGWREKVKLVFAAPRQTSGTERFEVTHDGYGVSVSRQESSVRYSSRWDRKKETIFLSPEGSARP